MQGKYTKLLGYVTFLTGILGAHVAQGLTPRGLMMAADTLSSDTATVSVDSGTLEISTISIPSWAPTSSSLCQSTTAATTAASDCLEVSVKGDATYCVEEAICSGDGDEPAGTNCPAKGSVAVADCYAYLGSYSSSGLCVAPSDAVCQKIETGAWGCVFSDSSSTGSTVAAATTSTSGDSSPSETSSGSSSAYTTLSEDTTTTTNGDDEGGLSSSAVAGIVAGVAVAAVAVTGMVAYKKRKVISDVLHNNLLSPDSRARHQAETTATA